MKARLAASSNRGPRVALAICALWLLVFTWPVFAEQATAPANLGQASLTEAQRDTASTAAAASDQEVFPGATWERWEDPAARGWNPSALAEAKDRFEARGGTALMIVDGGRVVAEWGDTDRPVNCHSVRKSFLSALYGIEIEKGRIDPSKTLEELGISDRGGLSATEQQATVLDLLKARSGVYHPAAYETSNMRKKRPERGSHDPGTFWYYNNWDFNALGSIFRQQTGEDIFQAFYDDIAVPIQMQDFNPDDGAYHHEDVSDHPAYKFYMSTRDRARFGLLYLHEGRWRDRQVVPRAWVEESTKPWSQAGRGIGYGYMWWVSTGSYHLTSKVRGKAFSARGHWGQYIVVLPEHDLVIAMANDKSSGAPKIKIQEILKMILASNARYLAALEGS